MKIPERERRDWRLTFLILLVGLSVMCLAGEFALKMAPRWSVVANMSSMLDPDATFAAFPTVNFVEPVLPEIETPISFVFLTPATNTVTITATEKFLPGTPLPTLESTQTPVTIATGTPSPVGTRTFTPSPTGTRTFTPSPTRTYTPTPTIIRPTWTYSPVPTSTRTPIPYYTDTPTSVSPGCTSISSSGSYAVSSSGTWFCFQTDGTNNGAILTFSVSDIFAADGAGLLWTGKAQESDPACGMQSFTFSAGSYIDTVPLYTVKNNLSGNPLQTYIYVSNVGSGMTSINISVDNPSWSTSGTNCPP